MSKYLELVEGVAQYYGSGSDQWLEIAKGGINPDVIKQVPGVTIIRARDGSYMGYDYKQPFPSTYNPVTDINSNVETGSYGMTTITSQIPATVVPDGSGGYTMQSGAIRTAGGTTLQTVADRISLATAGVAIGSKLGLAIDSALYNVAPEWWDETFPSVNPETWSQLIPEGEGGDMVRSLLGIDGMGNATMYLDERVLAYGYLAMLSGGAWNGDSETVDYHGSDMPFEGFTTEKLNLPIKLGNASMKVSYANIPMIFTGTSDEPLKAGLYSHSDTSEDYTLFFVSEGPSSGRKTYTLLNGDVYESTAVESSPFSIDDFSCYLFYDVRWSGKASFEPYEAHQIGDNWHIPSVRLNLGSLAWVLLYGNHIPATPEGINENAEAGTHVDPTVVINPKTGKAITPSDSVDDTLDALKTAYPDLFDEPVYQDVPQEDGTVTRISYIPVPYPTTDDTARPTTYIQQGVDPQVHPEVDPQVRPQTAQDIATDVTGPSDPPQTGSGDAPPAIVPTGSASALYSIYNPSDAELNAFGAWLWSNSFVDQLLKLFSDPMQAIIGLHKVFAPPAISGRGNIKVGYLDSGVQTNLVASQYVTIPCGSVRVSEYYGNALDYDPFTSAQIYLPFIGIQPLDIGDVMRGTVSVTYHVDVLTGACLAEVSVARDGAGGTIYTYAGNCSVQYPISSGSYMGIMSSMISLAGGIAGTLASGGALAPMALGSANALMSAKTRVQHSGSFSGNAGAMGAKVPYLIISRYQSAVSSRYEELEGVPSNTSTTIGQCSGYIRCKAVHLEGVPATSEELTELEEMLASGIWV